MTSLARRALSSADAELRPRAKECNRMAMPMRTWPRQGEWTVEEMWRLPETGDRFEVIDGVLHVNPSPNRRHQNAAGRLYRHLADYLETARVGWVYIAPSDVVLTQHRAVEPDVYVAPLVAGRQPGRTEDVTHLMVAVEVLSPGTADYDREEKRRLYQQHADEYWIVDLDARRIERWRPVDTHPEIVGASLEWHPAGASEPLVLDLPLFFDEVLDR